MCFRRLDGSTTYVTIAKCWSVVSTARPRGTGRESRLVVKRRSSIDIAYGCSHAQPQDLEEPARTQSGRLPHAYSRYGLAGALTGAAAAAVGFGSVPPSASIFM